MAIKIQGDTIVDDDRKIISAYSTTINGDPNHIVMKPVGTNRSVIMRNDGSAFYILKSGASVSPNPVWDPSRPLFINMLTGLIASSNGQIFSGGTTINNDLVVDTDTLFVDSTNDRVGVGTPTPTTLLHVAGNGSSYTNPANSNLPVVYVHNTNNANTSAHAIVSVRTGGTGSGNPFVSFDVSGDVGYAMGIDNADNSFKISNSWRSLTDDTRVTVSSTGDVGIGETSPGKKLHVNVGTASTVVARFESTASTNSASIDFLNPASGIDNIRIGSFGTSLGFITGGTESMRIIDTGRVGIGTISPSEKLHVEGNVRAITFSSANGVATSPAYDFASDSNTGMFLLGADTLGFATNGSTAAAFTSTGDLRLYNTAGNRYITISNQPTTNVTLTIPVLTTSSTMVLSEGNLTINGAKTFSDLIVSEAVTHTGLNSRDKYRVWNAAPYSIGMANGFKFGPLNNDFAMTFQMNSDNDRGWWWGDDAHANTEGAMALSTNGKLTVAHSVRVGFGEADTVIPGTNAILDVNGDISANILRIKSNGDASNTSTGHGLQIGKDNQVNLRIDNNEILVLDGTGQYSTLSLNAAGGDITIGTATGTAASSVMLRGSKVGVEPELNINGGWSLGANTTMDYISLGDQGRDFVISDFSEKGFLFKMHMTGVGYPIGTVEGGANRSILFDNTMAFSGLTAGWENYAASYTSNTSVYFGGVNMIYGRTATAVDAQLSFNGGTTWRNVSRFTSTGGLVIVPAGAMFRIPGNVTISALYRIY